MAPYYISRPLRRFLYSYWRATAVWCALFALEAVWHVRSFQVDSPSEALDLPFYTSCQEPKVDAPRSNATIVMLARNTDVDGAVIAVKSVEEHFNKWYHYPITFLNDKPWDPSFVNTLSKVASGETKFETIEQNMWGFPKWIDKKKASRKMRDQEAAGQMYAGKASYHHMCRFNSGFFYDHPALQKYKWFWRIEPDIRFTCDITYDPFIEMEKHKKKYGYTMALWEAGETVPSLYRKVSDWKEKRGVHDTLLWSAFLAPSTAPWPFRKFLSLLRNRNVDGDLWNMCHFWSNFEIADMDFFRSQEYRDFFDFLDLDGGFYYERWGDAPVHSLAVALFLSPRELHHFSDIGYAHPPFQYCPLREKRTGNFPQLKDMTANDWKERFNEAGCRCDYDPRLASVIDPTCMNIVRRALG